MTGIRDDGTHRVRDKKGNEVGQFGGLGAFSEYVVVCEDSCIPVDQDLDITKIALVGCRIPTGWGAVVNIANAKQGCTALVVGLGGVGFSIIQGLKSVGAVVIIAADIHDKKRWALEWGATHYLDASKHNMLEEVMKITGIGVDYAFDAIGDEEVEALTVQAVHKGGKAIWVGVPQDAKGLIKLDARILATFQKSILGNLYGGASPFEMAPRLIKMYRAGKIRMEEYITKEYQLKQIEEALEDMITGKNISGLIRFD